MLAPAAPLSAESAEWDDAARSRLTIYYRSSADWGHAIHSWAVEHGMALGALYTVYEMRTSGEWVGSDASALEPGIIVRALEALEREGLAILVRDGSTSIDEVGVKFIEKRR